MPERHPEFRFRVSCLLALMIVGLPLEEGVAQKPVNVPKGVPPRIHPLPPLRAQAKIEQGWAHKRVTEVLPILMREHGVDMWILSMREYGEDPVFSAIKAPTTFAARRRSIYVFYDRGPDQELERLALGGGSQGGVFEAYRSTSSSPRGDQAELMGDEQWQLLRELVEDRDPAAVAVNIDETWAFADDQLMMVSKPRAYSFAQVPAGKQLFWTKSENTSAIELEIEAGETYYLKVKIKMGLAKARAKILHIDEVEAQDYFQKCSYVEPTETGLDHAAEIVANRMGRAMNQAAKQE